MSYVRRTIDEMTTRMGGVIELARTDLAITAFGCQIFELPRNASSHRHREVASGQQELYANLAGNGWIDIDDQTVEFGPRTLIHVTPESMRMPRAGGHGLTYLCVGASAGEMYRPNPKLAHGSDEIRAR
jgi:hypothetical protein